MPQKGMSTSPSRAPGSRRWKWTGFIGERASNAAHPLVSIMSGSRSEPGSDAPCAAAVLEGRGQKCEGRPSRRRPFAERRKRGLLLPYVLRLEPFGTLDDLELHAIALDE